MITLDPVGYCLLRELAEADEAQVASDIARSRNRAPETTPNRALLKEWTDRYTRWTQLAVEFADHLVLTRQEIVDLSRYCSCPASYRLSRNSAARRLSGDVIALYRAGQIALSEGL